MKNDSAYWNVLHWRKIWHQIYLLHYCKWLVFKIIEHLKLFSSKPIKELKFVILPSERGNGVQISAEVFSNRLIRRVISFPTEIISKIMIVKNSLDCYFEKSVQTACSIKFPAGQWNLWRRKGLSLGRQHPLSCLLFKVSMLSSFSCYFCKSEVITTSVINFVVKKN